MFDKVLIANRGEIACRIIRSCRAMGIRSVAVYAAVDAQAQHVVLADEAHALDGQDPVAAYLDMDALVQLAKSCGAQAIHPGYGFLAENPSFVAACEQADLVFVGPTADTMAKIGSKSAAKACMAAAGIPVIPGYHGQAQDTATLEQAAEKVGFPLMIKASAGGGGKGMRIVESATEFLSALESARREAKKAFADEQVILERYLPRPRHIEVQVFGDRQGHILHLGERECSVQRRHQKIIEESPAPTLDHELRNKITAAAVSAARAVQYRGAGTVEFMLAGDEFYFLEMNTRLQVEHAVTEAVTGLDLVAWQLRVACGGCLPLRQDEISFDGHAIEVRIYAEDPQAGFLPASGRLSRVRWPPDRVRTDTGVAGGDPVSVYFDPMLAKIISHAANRPQAVAQLRHALQQVRLNGVNNNVGFLQQVLSSQVFLHAAIDTAYVDRELEALLRVSREDRRNAILLAVCKRLHDEDEIGTGHPWTMHDGWRLGAAAERSFQLHCAGAPARVSVHGYLGRYRIAIDEEPIAVAWVRCRKECCTLGLDSHVMDALVSEGDAATEVIFRHTRIGVTFVDPAASTTDTGSAERTLSSPMPASVVATRVAVGDTVTAGQALVVVEAMKMELVLTAPRDGTVAQLHCSAGDFVQADQVLLELCPLEATGDD